MKKLIFLLFVTLGIAQNNGIRSLNGAMNNSQRLVVDTSSSVSQFKWTLSDGVHTLNIPYRIANLSAGGSVGNADSLGHLPASAYINSTTYTIASYNTPPLLKARANFVCVDTVRNDTTINRVLTYLSGLSGVKNLVFLEGTYIDSGSIKKPTNINMFGYGAKIKMRSGLDTSMGVAFYADSGSHGYTGVYGFEFDGNESNNRGYTFNNIGGGFYTLLRTGTTTFTGGIDGGGLIGVARDMIVKDIYSHDFPRSCFVIAGSGHKIYNITGINSAQDHTLYISALSNSIIDGVTVEGFVANSDAHIIVSGEPNALSSFKSQTYNVKISNVNSRNWTQDPVASAYPRYLIKFRSPVHDVLVDGVNLNQTVQNNNSYFGAFENTLAGSNERIGINGINYTGFIGTNALFTMDSVKDCYITNSTFTQTVFPVTSGLFRQVFRMNRGTGMLFSNVTVDMSRDPYTNTIYFAQFDGSTVFGGVTFRDCNLIKSPLGTAYFLNDNASATINDINFNGNKGGNYFLKTGTPSRWIFRNPSDTVSNYTGIDTSYTNAVANITAGVGATVTRYNSKDFQLKLDTASLRSLYVPYSGANASVNLGAQSLTTTGTGTFGSLVTSTSSTGGIDSYTLTATSTTSATVMPRFRWSINDGSTQKDVAFFMGGKTSNTANAELRVYVSQYSAGFQSASLVGTWTYNNLNLGTNTLTSGAITSTGLSTFDSLRVKGARYDAIDTTSVPITLNNQNTILCNNTSNITITLPALALAYNSATKTGKVYYIKKINSSGASVTIIGTGGNTIDGNTSITFNTQWTSYELHAYSTGWYIK